MPFAYLTNVPLETAVREYLEALRESGMTPQREVIPVQNALGRITAEPVYAVISAPHYCACAMDGIAVCARDTFGATETTPVFLPEGRYTVVDTGDPLPENCDCVVMVEDVIQAEGGVKLYGAAAPWQHVRQIGEDICAGEMILGAHMQVTPSSIGAFLAGGVLRVTVLKRPVVGIIPTGDEIVSPTENPKPGDIVEFNSAIFSAMLKTWNADSIAYPVVRDECELIRSAVQRALDECDMVLLGAGSSAGRDDYSSQVLNTLGKVLYHGIAIKPGKPAILAVCGNKPVLGVPGYPVSGILVLEQILHPVIGQWYGIAAETGTETCDAVLSRRVVSGLKYEEFLRVQVGYGENGYTATPLNRGAGVVSSFMKADGILRIPRDLEGMEAGDRVRVNLMKPRERLQNTLVAVGSHDPLLDELANMIHCANPEYYMSSTHVGSLGGLMAVRRGEAHVAGTHLLSEEDGSYNAAYLKRYFPDGGVKLVECVGRTQGIMVQKGNPKGITRLSDLSRRDVRYVNRQKGSGTRVLLDYLLRRSGMSGSEINGYEREELTHTAVAAQIAPDSADAGLGILSAARIYGLDFIPVCTETYDLLLPDRAFEMSIVQTMLEILKGEPFRRKMEAMGGYTLNTPGRIKEY